MKLEGFVAHITIFFYKIVPIHLQEIQFITK